jgi:hypothetical protein
MICAQSRRVFRTIQGVRLKQPTFPRVLSDAMSIPLAALMFLPETWDVAQDMAWQHRSAAVADGYANRSCYAAGVLLEYLRADGLLWRSTRKLGHGAAVQWCCDRVFSRLVGHSIPGCLWKCGKEQASGLPYWVRLV